MKTLCICILFTFTTLISFGQKVKKSSTETPVLNFDLSYLNEDDEFLEFDIAALETKNYLVIIGVDTYKHWNPLNNAVKDANDIKKILLEKYTFSPDYVFELYNEEVTYEKVREVFEKVKAEGNGLDNLLIYYSGHGFYDESFNEGYWIPYDAKLGEVSTYTNQSVIVFV